MPPLRLPAAELRCGSRPQPPFYRLQAVPPQTQLPRAVFTKQAPIPDVAAYHPCAPMPGLVHNGAFPKLRHLPQWWRVTDAGIARHISRYPTQPVPPVRIHRADGRVDQTGDRAAFSGFTIHAFQSPMECMECTSAKTGKRTCSILRV